MCGLAGIYTSNKRVKLEDLKIMSKTLQHRGPDGEGFWINKQNNLGFAHRRLSILDLSENASQPMHFLNRYTIIFNGEIYNYIELKEELKNKGYVFSSSTDTEVLVALFAEYGNQCLLKLDGMFAFAIYDSLEQNLFVARDRFGEKPFYYTITNGSFYFASEMKALFCLNISKTIAPERIYNYLQNNSVIDNHFQESTFYENVFQLPASNYMILKNGKIVKTFKYWDLNNVEINNNISFKDAVLEYRRLLNQSIKRRLRSDVIVGSSLSGGLDSTSIVLILNSEKQNDQEQKTFSARFANFDKDEGRYMDLAIEHSNGINPQFVWPNAEGLLDDLQHLTYHQEEPFVSGSIYAQYKVMWLAKEKGVTVLLDGQGADEQLGGYIRYYHHYISTLLIKNPKLFFQEKNYFNKLHKGLSKTYNIPRRLPLWLLKSKIFNEPYRYDKDIRTVLKEEIMFDSLAPLLRYADRNSMAFSREVRLPFLSHELVEFTFSLPTSFLFNKGWTKYILRKSVENIIPAKIAWRKDKIGYEPPQEKWNSKIGELIKSFKNGNNYLELTGGKRVTSAISDWQWLMLKLFKP